MSDPNSKTWREPLISDTALYSHFEGIVMPTIAPFLTYDQWMAMAHTATCKWVRDVYEDDRVALIAQIAEKSGEVIALKEELAHVLAETGTEHSADGEAENNSGDAATHLD